MDRFWLMQATSMDIAFVDSSIVTALSQAFDSFAVTTFSSETVALASWGLGLIVLGAAVRSARRHNASSGKKKTLASVGVN